MRTAEVCCGKGVELFRKLYPALLQRHNGTLLEKAFTRVQMKAVSELFNQLIRSLEKEQRDA